MYSKKNDKKISLTCILEKILKDEELDKKNYIKYISNLLKKYSKSTYLDGLNIDFIDFDIPENDIKQLENLKANHTQTITDNPVIFYINSISQLDSSKEDAIIWNVIVIKAAIYLIALPELKPELFKKDYTEHFNTIKRLFNRFRLANNVLIHSKNLKYQQHYYQLWNDYLPSPTLSLENFVLHIESSILALDAKDQSYEFMKHLLNDVRIPFDYVLKDKAKIAKPSSDKTIQIDFLDEDQFIQEVKEFSTQTKRQGITDRRITR